MNSPSIPSPQTHKRTRSLVKHLGMLGAVLVMSSATESSAQSDPTLIGAGQRPFVIMVVDSSASMDFSLEGEQKFPCYDGTDAAGNPIPCDTAAGMGANQPPDNISGYPSLFEWRAGSQLGDSDNALLDESLPWNQKDYENPLVGPAFVGPCMVWKDACRDYSRPPWSPELLDEPGIAASITPHMPNNTDEYDPRMWERLRAMRGLAAGFDVAKGNPGQLGPYPSRRLRDSNQPRHVQVKEILTGDMILRPEDAFVDPTIPLNPAFYGPGCWFVPRMSGVHSAKTQWHACAEIDFSGDNPRQRSCTNDSDCASGTTCREVELGSRICVRERDGDHVNSFYRMIDRKEPRPHIQEVYDRQLETGIMDNLANTALFAVAMFDGSQGKVQGDISDLSSPVEEINTMDSRQPVINDSIPLNVTGTYPSEEAWTYDLGVYKIIGPTQLDVPSSQLPSLSSFTQYAVKDAGYLRNYRNDNEAEDYRIDPGDSSRSRLDYNFSSGVEQYVQPFQLGQQPLSGATPLAAAMRDIHMYMRNGQAEFDYNGRAEDGSQGTYDPDADGIKELNKESKSFIVNPVEQDPYRRCRAKHVVLMTDGFPEPERESPAPVNIKVGSDRLSSHFGYPDAANRYPYETAENEIRDLVEDMHLTDVEGSNPLFMPRVHVVGLNLVNAQSCVNDGDCSTLSSELSCAQINGRNLCAVDNNNNDVPDRPEKLGRMAAAGKTCAQWQLVQGDGKKFVPSAWPAIGGQSGTCDPSDPTNNCLVRQLPDADAIPFVTNEGVTVNCIAPALILEQNDQYQSEVAGSRPFRDDLTEALQLVFNQVLTDSGGVASRTRATILNSLDDTDLRGQYRTFSGVNVEGSSVYWEGLLERQTLSCQAAGGALGGVTNKSLNDEIDGQVRVNMSNPSGYEDNRRIFTTVSLKAADGSLWTTSPNLSSTIFHAHEMDNYLVADRDEFQNTRFSGPHALEALVRVPFEVESLLEKNGASLITALTDDFLRILNAEDEAVARETVNVVRGRISKKEGRVMGAILNSNPISVGPPSLDLPIGSYRAFREKYGNRPSMLYVATLDGLLHAVHTGEGDDPSELGIVYSGVNGSITNPSGDEGTTLRRVFEAADDTQREAWAYAPEMLKNRYSRVRDVQPNLMDGSPTVADVRLCNGRPSANQNVQACEASETSGAVSGADQWRTVLVQGLGVSGAGYFALDVTHTGGRAISSSNPSGFSGPNRRPDPIPLWEFDWDWEQRQILALKASGQQARYAYSPGVNNAAPSLDNSTSCNDAENNIDFSGEDVDELEDLPFMGLSVGDASIGTVVLTGVDSSDSSRRVQRPVAIFSGGLNGTLPGPSGFGSDPNDCLARERRGRAIYVVDLQTGSLLRRFVDYTDVSSNVYRFQAEVAGTPAMYDNRPGVVSNRAFVGDVAGRMFRIDLSSADPNEWNVELMFDPCIDAQIKTSAGVTCDLFSGNDDLISHPRPFGPASFAPSVALDANRRVMVVYGLGERTDTSVANQVQAMIAVRERDPSEPAHELAWFTTFEDESSPYREKLTGPPAIFNYGVYFTTFIENKSNVCEPGLTRIWGLGLQGDGVPGSKATTGALDFTTDGSSFSSADIEFSSDPSTGLVEWYEPQEPMLVRGVTVAFPPDCSEDVTVPGGNLADNPESAQALPELIATTSNPMNTVGDAYGPNNNNDLMAGGSGRLGFQVKRIASPRSTISPLSWSVVGQ